MIAKSDINPGTFALVDTSQPSSTDSNDDFQAHTWEELKHIISTNNLAVLQRKSSEVNRYIDWTQEIKFVYGSITNFICKERLHWESLPSYRTDSVPTFACRSLIPFAHPDDYKILLNDWPYGLTANVSHLVIWLKTRIAVEETKGDITAESRQIIQDFIQLTFSDRLAQDDDPKDRVLWFKNWSGLQSVRGLEHVHVLVRDVPQSILEEWTKGEEKLF